MHKTMLDSFHDVWYKYTHDWYDLIRSTDNTRVRIPTSPLDGLDMESTDGDRI